MFAVLDDNLDRRAAISAGDSFKLLIIPLSQRACRLLPRINACNWYWFRTRPFLRLAWCNRCATAASAQDHKAVLQNDALGHCCTQPVNFHIGSHTAIENSAEGLTAQSQFSGAHQQLQLPSLPRNDDTKVRLPYLPRVLANPFACKARNKLSPPVPSTASKISDHFL